MTTMSRLTTALHNRYRVERELGQGGMATVYLAHDLRHERDVAIKVLHPDLGAALGAERFLSEIKTTARLQHPHILPLLDSGAADGLLYYVMPYVRGETLRARLERETQLPIADAVRIATEVAEALQAAHALGIVHRDIKPENILLQDGHALVADFGIALAVQQAGGQRITQTGLSLGTPAYMSPEQAGAEKTLDGRSDQYALAAVLYEMLAGAPPFTGPSVAAVMARLMTERPRPVHEQRASVPPAVSAAVGRALEKLPADRFASCAEFARALGDSHTARADAVGAPASARSRWRPAVGIAAAALLAAGAWWMGQQRRRDDDRVAVQGALLVPPRLSFARSLGDRAIGVTDDGREVIYSARAGNDDPVSRLYIQRIDEDSATLIPGSEDLTAPTPSPDGRWLAANNASGRLVVIPLRGGAADLRPLVDGTFNFLAWADDGTLVLSRGDFLSVERLDPATRTLTTLVRVPDPGVWVQAVLAGGDRALVVRGGNSAKTGTLAVLDLATGTLATVLDAQVAAARLTPGFLAVQVAGGDVQLVPFDERRGTVTGAPVTVARGVFQVGGNGSTQLAAARRHPMIVYGGRDLTRLVLVDNDGGATPVTTRSGEWHRPTFSPDGRRLLADLSGEDGRNVWAIDLASGVPTRATTARNGHDAIWAPDGRSFVFLSDESGPLGLRRGTLDAAARPESLYTGPLAGAPTGWHPGSGDLLVSAVPAGRSNMDVLRIGAAGRGPVSTLYGEATSDEISGAISPDGRWLAYGSDVGGRSRVYVRPANGAGPAVTVTPDGGSEPLWSRDGRTLYFRMIDGRGERMGVARVEPGAELRITPATTRFPIDRYSPATPHTNFDVAPDGSRFVFVEAGEISRIVLVHELEALYRQRQGAR
ncbi:protein kinase [Gemmatimonas sp.]|uniref:protein kinase domain-containing protein n=1 Tax=Gemmatimonas sp. TaxID=1962908 RepID=UPI00261DFC90|nr:protein kinase [Gemmatimonas sp.]